MLMALFIRTPLLALLLPAAFGAPHAEVNGNDLDRRAPSCGVKGYDNGVDAYYYDSSGTQSTYAQCSAICKKDTNCVSFAISSSVCMLFTVTVASNVVSDPASPFNYWDAACISPASSTPPASSSPPPLTSSRPTSTVLTSSSVRASSSSPPPASSTLPSTSATATSSPPPPATTLSSTATSQISTSTSTATTSSATSTSTLAGLPGCLVNASYSISSFSFFNSSHNLDCYYGPDLGNNTACYNVTTLPDGTNKSVPCESSLGPCQTCASICSPGAAQEPFGYGPPDKVSFIIDNYKSCYHTNPNPNAGFVIGVGWGFVMCGENEVSVRFWGSSEPPTPTGFIEFKVPTFCSDGKRSGAATYRTGFNLTCAYDSGRNATCTNAAPLRASLSELWVF